MLEQNTSFKTPILLIVFNRLDTTKKMFDTVRRVKPEKVYIASDGPRNEKEEEYETIVKVRNYLIESIDWNCEIKTLFQKTNLGCQFGPIEAINWFFKNEKMGIILEDDCVTSESFFYFCQELLIKYEKDTRIATISGDIRRPEDLYINTSYTFCKYFFMWGWASWRRVWKLYDPFLKNYNPSDNKFINSISRNSKTRHFWKRIFDRTKLKRNVTWWDYQMMFLLLHHNMLSVIPQKNMVCNIGFGENATHTFDPKLLQAFNPNNEIEFPLVHPKSVKLNIEISDWYDKNEYCVTSKLKRLWLKLKKLTFFPIIVIIFILISIILLKIKII